MPDEVCVYVVYNTFKHLVSTFPFIQSLAHEKKKDKNINIKQILKLVKAKKKKKRNLSEVRTMICTLSR